MSLLTLAMVSPQLSVSDLDAETKENPSLSIVELYTILNIRQGF